MNYLYGAPHSAYTGKARAYLLKQGIAFEERAMGHPRFMQDIIPVIQRFMIPVLETEDGGIVQDTADIIDHFIDRDLEQLPSRPAGAVARAVSHLFDLFGGEGLLRAGMFYRWHFDDANLAFLEDQFGLFAAPNQPPAQRLAMIRQATGAMRKRAEQLGVSPGTAPVIEAGALAFLDAFNAHLLDHPYLVGGSPTLGDYGLQVMLYAHLARDPWSGQLMKNRSRAVLRWTERMNQPGRCVPEYLDYPANCFANEEIPETLATLMRLVATDYLPELQANVAFHNQWLNEHPVEEGTVISKAARPRGEIEFRIRGTDVRCSPRSYSIYMLQRLQDWVDSLNDDDRAAVVALFEQTGCRPFIDERCSRRVERANHREVWGRQARP